MITAPYNFVPLNKEVFYPDWADDVSLDKPFRDGESGEIEITVTAKSPIFVRDSKDETKFCNYKGEYFIPGSSVKGMVRSVLEVLSFAKLNSELFTDNTFAVRDLSSAKNFYMKQMSQLEEPLTHCGWLKKTQDGYVIEDCGIPGRIHHEQIDSAFGVEFSKFFQPDNFDAKKQEQKSAKYKYEKLGKLLPSITVGNKYRTKSNPYDKREFYNYEDGGTKATLVLTGQPTPRTNSGEQGDGKGFEFLFFERKRELKVSKKVMDDFLFAYFDGRDTEPKESPDWTFWKQKLKDGEKVPVFFQTNGVIVLHFGLSYLYKLPYKHSIKDGINKEHFNDDELDLAQTIFGHVSKNTKKALKGRVNFSHLKLVSKAKELPARTEILGTPRASYYPNYLRQNGSNYRTYMDANFSISGRKRYPVHKSSKPKQTTDTGNKNVGTTFKPLEEGVVFYGKVRYHNLKKIELGALLSALTFHDTKDTFHSLGLAKSLGYGKVKVDIKGIDNIDEYLREFEFSISRQVTNWRDSEQVVELLTMATEQNNSGNSTLRYMELEEFAKNKTTKSYLRPYSNLEGISSVKLKTKLTSEDISKLDQEYEKFLKEREQKIEERRQERIYQKDLKNIENSTDINQLQAFVEKYPNSLVSQEVQKTIDKLLFEKEAEKEKQRLEKERKQRAKKLEEERKKAEEEAKKRAKLEAGIDCSSSKDHKDLERAIKGFEKTDEHIQKLISCIKEIYPSLNAKKKKQFARSKELIKWIGKDSFEELLGGL